MDTDDSLRAEILTDFPLLSATVMLNACMRRCKIIRLAAHIKDIYRLIICSLIGSRVVHFLDFPSPIVENLNKR